MAKKKPAKRKTSPKRSLSADAIARKTGRRRRAVLLWAARKQDPCPHDPGPLFNLPEVQAWLDDHGMDRVKPESGGGGGASKRKATTGTATPEPPKAASAPPPPEEPQEPPPPDIEPTGDVAYDRLLQNAHDQVYRLSVRARKQAMDPGVSVRELSIIQSAIKDASAEYRQLLREGDRVREQMQSWLPRRDAMRAIASVMDAAAGDLDRSRKTAPANTVQQLLEAELIDPGDAEEVTRIMAAELHRQAQESAGSRRRLIKLVEGEL